MIPPSPFRKLVPPLIWPVGVLLIVGYCYLENRSEPLPCAPSGRGAPMASAGRGGVVLDSAFAEHVGMVQGHTVTVGFSEGMNDISAFGPMVSADAQAATNQAIEDVKAGKVTLPEVK